MRRLDPLVACGRGSPPRPAGSGTRRVAAEELVEAVDPGHVDGQAVAAAPRPPPHLPQARRRCPGSRRRSPRRARRCRSRARARWSRRPRAARRSSAGPRSRGAAGACSRPGRERSASARSRRPRSARLVAGEAAGSARRRGGCRRSRSSASPASDELGEHVGGLARAPSGGRPAARSISGGFQIAIRRAGPRGAVGVDQVERRADEPLGQLQRVGDRRRGEDEAGLGAVAARTTRRSRRRTLATWEPKTPAVDVRLVDDDVAELARSTSPQLRWWGRTPTWSMSGLVRIRFERRRIAGRSSRGVSPS